MKTHFLRTRTQGRSPPRLPLLLRGSPNLLEPLSEPDRLEVHRVALVDGFVEVGLAEVVAAVGRGPQPLEVPPADPVLSL